MGSNVALDTGRGMLRAIIDDPADDVARLAYADWLDETGTDPAYAEFIRVQVELNKLSNAYSKNYTTADNDRRKELRSLESDLFSSISRGLVKSGLSDERATIINPRSLEVGNSRFSVMFSRGFVASFRSYDLYEFVDSRWVGKLFASQPVERVLTNRESQDYHNNDESSGEGRLHGWFRRPKPPMGEVMRYDIPDEIWDLMVKRPGCVVNGNWADFKTYRGAVEALNSTLILFGRQEAGKLEGR